MQYTENLNLAKYDANDVTSYLEVSNANLVKIDAGHGTLNAQVTANTSAIGDLQEDVNGMAPQVADANTKANAGLSNTASVYDATQTYAVGDYVLYNNNLYRCITAVTQAESFDGTKWERIKIDGVLSEISDNESDNREEINNIKESLRWKTLGTLLNGGTINLPASFNELSLDFTIVTGIENVRMKLFLTREDLGGINRLYRTGYYANANANAFASVEANTESISGLNVWQNGTNINASANCIISYR